ncbi:hypothetical protein ACMA1I_21875 [Pontibacter sp. 13R65]|uniref:hypothetical protein n=1 Tax=Pontibacter sp. 13R65 TaxID=3127458 RepID=UPI00301C897E
MKKTLLTTILGIFSVAFCFAQDVITTRTGEDIQAKIFEVSQLEVKYKRFDNQTGPTFILPKSEILLVLYENGTSDMFNSEPVKEYVMASNSGVDNYTKGRSDALIYYDGYKPAATGTLVAGLISPLIGLIPAIACSSTTPQAVNLYSPDAGLMQDPNYYKGFTQQAKKTKQGKVWKNWGIAFGVNLVAVLLLSSGS